MKIGIWNRDSLRRDTLARFIGGGVLSVCVAFTLLAAGWLLSIARLHDMKERLFVDAQSLNASYQLEIAVRDATQGRQSVRVRRLLDELPRFSTSGAENDQLRNLDARFRLWQRGGAVEPLLQSINAHRTINEAQMRDSMRQSARVEIGLRWIVPLLLLGTLAALGWSGWKLWQRLFQPMLKLSHAAEEFGQGAMNSTLR